MAVAQRQRKRKKGAGGAKPAVLLLDMGEATPVLEPALLSQGWPVAVAADAHAALHSLEAGGLDIVVVPESKSLRSTVSLLRRLSEAAPGARRIVLLRDDSAASMRAYANQGGAHHLLVAPFNARRVIQAIRQEWERAGAERLAWLQESHGKASLEHLRALMQARTAKLSQTNRELRTALRQATQKNKALAALNTSLRIQSTTDPLTGLFNRREFLNRIRTEWGRYRRYRRPLSLIMVDIDHFKRVNDTYGHECGDRVLRSLGHLISRNKRAQDLCCRYGGEEFVVLLTETTLDAAFHVAEGLRRLIGRHRFEYDGQDIDVRVSLGVSGAAEQQPSDVEAFINLSDKAMYRAKREGRDRTVVLDPADESRIARQSIAGPPGRRGAAKANAGKSSRQTAASKPARPRRSPR